ncbi:MAG: hypothetical protein OXE44_17375 [Nitrospinae bacterium]|nr:hypothetical protein [Nitrospinota bacterium]
MDPESRKIRSRQMLLLSSLAAAVLVAFAAWFSAGGSEAPPPRGGVRAKLAGAGSAEAVWVRRSEARIGQMEARLREMETKNRRSEEENARLRARLDKGAADGRMVIDRQAAAIDELRKKLETRPVAPVRSKRRAPAGKTSTAPTGPMIREFHTGTGVEGTNAPDTGPRPLSSWLPAGAYADAVVLAGVDASAGVSSQGDPRPVLLRLTGKARSAASGGAAMEADVEGCTLTGAAYGDLSSEKVYVRLQTMTCAGAEAATVIETRVSGFVAGGGKAGVRGPVVSREGALVEKAFLAGLVSGVGETAANVLQAPAGTAGAENAASLSDLGRAGLGAGAGSAGRRVADYLIRRAEQYQPVIQLQTGTRVTVVFIEGARIDGSEEKKSNNHGRNR